MKRNKVFSMMTMVFLMILMTMDLMACGSAGSGSSENVAPPGTDMGILPGTGEDLDDPIPDNVTTAEVTITMDLPGVDDYDPGQISPQSVMPGVTPFELFGSLIGQIDFGNRQNYDPWNYSVPYPVSGGQFTGTFTIPVGQTWHLGYETNGKRAAHNITIGSTPMTRACILGDPATYSTWGVVSFMVNRDENGVVTVVENPNCTAIPVVAQIRRDGDSANPLYDDEPFLPYDGTSEGPMLLNSSMAEWPVQQTMATFVSPAWVEPFYMYATGTGDPIINNAWFSLYQDAVRRSIVPPINTEEPGLGGFKLVVYDMVGTTQLCASTELVHWLDIDQTAGNFYAAHVERIDSTSMCPVQLGDNRNEIQ